MSKLKIGELCAAFHPEHELWYRAVIKAVLSPQQVSQTASLAYQVMSQSLLLPLNVMGVCLPSRSAFKKHNQEEEKEPMPRGEWGEVLSLPLPILLAVRFALPLVSRRWNACMQARAHIPLRTPWISPKMCLPCLIIMQYCYFDYSICSVLAA